MFSQIVIHVAEFVSWAFPVVQGLTLAGACAALLLHRRNRISQELLSRMLQSAFIGVIMVQITLIVLLYVAQYFTWQSYGPSAYFLPPHQPWGYFFQYSWFYFARGPIMTFGLGIVFFLLFRAGYAVSKGRFFYEDEQYSGALAILANPWPQNILVIVGTVFIGLVIAVFRFGYALARKRNARNVLLSLRILWPIVGLGVLLAGYWIRALPLFQQIKL